MEINWNGAAVGLILMRAHSYFNENAIVIVIILTIISQLQATHLCSLTTEQLYCRSRPSPEEIHPPSWRILWQYSQGDRGHHISRANTMNPPLTSSFSWIYFLCCPWTGSSLPQEAQSPTMKFSLSLSDLFLFLVPDQMLHLNLQSLFIKLTVFSLNNWFP